MFRVLIVLFRVFIVLVFFLFREKTLRSRFFFRERESVCSFARGVCSLRRDGRRGGLLRRPLFFGRRESPRRRRRTSSSSARRERDGEGFFAFFSIGENNNLDRRERERLDLFSLPLCRGNVVAVRRRRCTSSKSKFGEEEDEKARERGIEERNNGADKALPECG